MRDERVGNRIGRIGRRLSAILGSAFFIVAAMAAVEMLLPRANVPHWLTIIASGLMGLLLWANARRTYYMDLSARDGLTGLNNKLAYDEDVARLIRRQRPFTVFFLDVDRFKLINDNHGHEAGDLVLMDFSSSIVRYTDEDECAYRVGGDEFVVVCTHPLDEAAAEEKALEIERAVTHPIPIRDGEIVPETSVGYARFPEDGADEQAITVAADRMMYERKERHHERAEAGLEAADALERIRSFDLYDTMCHLALPYIVYRAQTRLDLLFANDAFLNLMGASSLEAFVEATAGDLAVPFGTDGAKALRALAETGSEPGGARQVLALPGPDATSRSLSVFGVALDNQRGERLVCASLTPEPGTNVSLSTSLKEQP